MSPKRAVFQGSSKAYLHVGFPRKFQGILLHVGLACSVDWDMHQLQQQQQQQQRQQQPQPWQWHGAWWHDGKGGGWQGQ